MTSRKSLRLAHTSDIHLGMSNDWQKDFSTAAFKSVIDAVPRLEADILLLAGDIFDHSRVSDDLLEFFTEQVGRLPVPVVALPGNHDCYDSTSVYRRGPFHKLPENLHVITALEGESFSFPGMGLTVWGGLWTSIPRLPSPGRDSPSTQRGLVRSPGPRPLPLRVRQGQPLISHPSRGDRCCRM